MSFNQITVFLKKIVPLAELSKEQLQKIRAALELEERKQKVVQGTALASLAVPLLGNVLYQGITKTYEWANRNSENYKALRRLVA